MSFLDKLERKFGFLAIKGLMNYVVALSGLVFIMSLLDKTFISKIALNPDLIIRGEVWRLVTYIFIPPSTSLIFIIFVLGLYYTIGASLEQEWGSFKFNIYYFIGMLGTTIGAFLTGGSATSLYLNTSLFLAFAKIYPNYEMLIYFILPVKVKYLAWLEWAFIAITIIFSPLSLKVSAIVSIINYFVFFGKDIITGVKNNRTAYENKKRFYADIPKTPYMHKCSVCGITDKDDPKMEFRYCSKCEGQHCYCMNHIIGHEHKVGSNKE